MSNRQRADLFAQYVGLELKGRIVSQGSNATAVANFIGRSPSAFNRWLNGKAEIPLAVLCQACEAIDIDPTLVVDYAYNRMAVVLGERNGEKYDPDVVTGAIEEVAGFEGSAGE